MRWPVKNTAVFRTTFPTKQSPLYLGQSCGRQSVALLLWGLQKEQMGETLREVRSQQLQVTKEQYEEKIDEKNKELQQLKLTLGKTVRILNFRKVSGTPSASAFPFPRVTRELISSSYILPFHSQRMPGTSQSFH